MRWFFTLYVAAASAVLAAGTAVALAAPVATRSDYSGLHVTRATLGNGLRVVIVEDHSLPVIHLAVRYQYGTDGEPAKLDGLAHALEHMMFRGTHALSGRGLTELQGRLGVDANAETDREETRYFETFPADLLAVELHVEADRMQGLALRDTDWASEQPALLEEIREAAARPAGVLEDAVRAHVYGAAGRSFAHGGTGTAAGIHAVTAAALRRAYAAAYTPGNAVLVIAGDVAPQTALALTRSIFSPVARRPRMARATQPPAHRGGVVRTDGGYRTLVDVALASSSLSHDEGESIAVELLSPDHSTLSTLLVEQGPCASYRLDDDTELHGGMHHLVCTVDEDETAAHALAAIHAALRTLAAHPPHRAIALARRSYIDATAFIYDDLADEANLFGSDFATLDIDPRALDRLAARVTDERVAAVLRRWTEPLAFGIAIKKAGRPDAVAEKRTRSEKLRKPRGDEPIVEPAWARVAPRDPRLTALAVDAFALPNGVRVFIDRHHGNRTVYVRAGVDNPGAFAGTGRAATAHLLNSGTRRWPRKRVGEVAEQRGMTVELAPESGAHGFARDLPVMLDIIADAWRTPRPVFGKLHDLLAATERPERFWIAITGDVDPDTVRATVARAFGGWRAKPAAPEPSAMPPAMAFFRRPGIQVFPGDRPTVRVAMLLPAPRVGEPDADTMTLLSEVLGAGGDFDTRLMHELRFRRGLSYGGASFYGSTDFDGYLVVAFECARGDLTAARAAVHRVLDGMRSDPPSAAVLERARRKVAVAALLSLTSADGRLDALAAARAHGVPADPQQLLRNLSTVTPADAARVAGTYFRRNRIIELDSYAR